MGAGIGKPVSNQKKEEVGREGKEEREQETTGMSRCEFGKQDDHESSQNKTQGERDNNAK
jgi:hypothetical protein